MIYCISDIHGQYKQYKRILECIDLKEEDTLYVLGDVIDRGPESLKVLEDMMRRTNVFPIIGNHEYMAMSCLHNFMKEITEKSISEFNEDTRMSIEDWFCNGGYTTYKEFIRLSRDTQNDILEYLGEFSLYEEIEVNNKHFVLTHGGIGNFSEERPLHKYSLVDMAFTRPDYSKVYYTNKYLVTGHTPTVLIDEECKEGTIYMKNNHIAIDCGSVFGLQLGAICLDTLETFYVK